MIYLSSEDGTIRRYDGRQDTKRLSAQSVIQTRHEMTDVKFHPVMEHLFANSNAAGDVFLRDDRMAFTSSRSRREDGIVQKVTYHALYRRYMSFCITL